MLPLLPANLFSPSSTRGQYGDGASAEPFTYTLALVFFQCVVNYFYALLMGRLVLKQGEDTTRASYYAVCSLTYLVAMVTSNKALMWVNYPTQGRGRESNSMTERCTRT